MKCLALNLLRIKRLICAVDSFANNRPSDHQPPLHNPRFIFHAFIKNQASNSWNTSCEAKSPVTSWRYETNEKQTNQNLIICLPECKCADFAPRPIKARKKSKPPNHWLHVSLCQVKVKAISSVLFCQAACVFVCECACGCVESRKQQPEWQLFDFI